MATLFYSASKSASTNCTGSNGAMSCNFSPVPTYLMGRPSSDATAKTMPPRAVPSSLVRMTPLTPESCDELLGLDESVLAGSGVHYQQHFMGCLRVVLLQDLHDLLQLLHQVELGMQATGGIHDQDVGASCLRRLHGIVNDRSRIGAVLVAYHRNADSLAPGLDLLRGGGAEGIARGQHHSVLLSLQLIGKLGDTGSLANAVDAYDQVDRDGRGLRKDQRLRISQQDFELFFEGVPQLATAREMLRLSALAQRLYELLGRLHADVAANQRLLQLVPELLRDVIVLQSLVDPAEDLAGAPETEPERVTEEAPLRRGCRLRLATFGKDTSVRRRTLGST